MNDSYDSNKSYMQRTPISIGIGLSCLARHQAHGPLARVPQKSLFTEGFYPAHGVNRCSRIRGNSGSPWWRFCYSVYIRNQRRRRAFYFHRAFPERRIYCVMSSGNAADVAQTLNLFRVCSFSRSMLDKKLTFYLCKVYRGYGIKCNVRVVDGDWRLYTVATVTLVVSSNVRFSCTRLPTLKSCILCLRTDRSMTMSYWWEKRYVVIVIYWVEARLRLSLEGSAGLDVPFIRS